MAYYKFCYIKIGTSHRAIDIIIILFVERLTTHKRLVWLWETERRIAGGTLNTSGNNLSTSGSTAYYQF